MIVSKDMQREFGILPQAAFNGNLDVMLQVVEASKSGGKLQVRNQAGSVIEEWRTLKYLFSPPETKEELDEE